MDRGGRELDPAFAAMLVAICYGVAIAQTKVFGDVTISMICADLLFASAMPLAGTRGDSPRMAVAGTHRVRGEAARR